jgi:hypothetical protein
MFGWLCRHWPMHTVYQTIDINVGPIVNTPTPSPGQSLVSSPVLIGHFIGSTCPHAALSLDLNPWSKTHCFPDHNSTFQNHAFSNLAGLGDFVQDRARDWRWERYLHGTESTCTFHLPWVYPNTTYEQQEIIEEQKVNKNKVHLIHEYFRST